MHLLTLQLLASGKGGGKGRLVDRAGFTLFQGEMVPVYELAHSVVSK